MSDGRKLSNKRLTMVKDTRLGPFTDIDETCEKAVAGMVKGFGDGWRERDVSTDASAM